MSLGGRPLIAFGIEAALRSSRFDRIICSTDDDEIADVAFKTGIEVDRRPATLATDEAAVADVARDFLARSDPKPDILVLVQPTSPFLTPKHICSLLDAMSADFECNSAQTITSVAHNAHAWNQRFFDHGRTGFVFENERLTAFNKQLKPKYFCFGNLVAARPRALFAGADFFAQPSIGIQIEWPYNFDLDVPSDLVLAEAILRAGLVDLGGN